MFNIESASLSTSHCLIDYSFIDMFYFYLSASWNNPDYGRCNNPFYFGAETRSAGCYFYITLRTWTSIPIQNRKNLSFPVTAKLFTLSAIESEQPNAYRRIWNHSDAYATAQYPSAQLICATTFSVPNRILERPTKLSKTHPNPPFGCFGFASNSGF